MKSSTVLGGVSRWMSEGGPLALPPVKFMSEKKRAPRAENHTGPSMNLKPPLTSVAATVGEPSGLPYVAPAKHTGDALSPPSTIAVLLEPGERTGGASREQATRERENARVPRPKKERALTTTCS